MDTDASNKSGKTRMDKSTRVKITLEELVGLLTQQQLKINEELTIKTMEMFPKTQIYKVISEFGLTAYCIAFWELYTF